MSYNFLPYNQDHSFSASGPAGLGGARQPGAIRLGRGGPPRRGEPARALLRRLPGGGVEPSGLPTVLLVQHSKRRPELAGDE